MSAGDTRCYVGRMTWMRRIEPSAKAPSIAPAVTRTLSHRPHRIPEFLRLHGRQPAYRALGRFKRRSPEMLVVAISGRRCPGCSHVGGKRHSRPAATATYLS